MLTLWQKVENAFDLEDEYCRVNHLTTSNAVRRILKICLKVICEHLEK